MSEELSVGVRILLERSKTNPDELKEEYGQWGQLREAVFAYKERKDRGPWLRGLTEQEIDALYEMFNTLYRGVFDAWVMKTVLGGDEDSTSTFKVQNEVMRLDASGKLGIGGHTWNDPRLYQNAIPPGSIQAIKPSPINPTTTVSLANAMKILGIK